MPVHELAALGAALAWAVAGLVSTGPSRALGAMGFVRVRMIAVFAMLSVAAAATGGWGTIDAAMWTPVLLSGFAGIFLGDTALFACLNRVGPRAAGLLFATNAPITVLLGWLALGEGLTPFALAGVALAFGGVALAIAFGRPRGNARDHWLERVSGPLPAAVALGLLAATFQAAGTLLARPVMLREPDPVAVSAIRVGIAALALQVAALPPFRLGGLRAPLSPRLLGEVALSGLLAMGLGMTLLLFALEGAKAGIVAVLSATTPVMLLPLLWAGTGAAPRPASWIGAAAAVAGTAIIFLR